MIKEIQPNLPVQLIPVKGSSEYTKFHDFYEMFDTILLQSNLDLKFAELYVEAIKREHEAKNPEYLMSDDKKTYYQAQGVEAFRCNLVRDREQYSYVNLSKNLGANQVLQRFCKLREVDLISVPSSSQVQRYATLVPAEELQKIHDNFNQILYTDQRFLGNIQAGDLYLDSTCVKANMHYPVDWVLFRDASSTMTKAITLIRDAGLKCRMKSPDEFMRDMNGLCIKMSSSMRKHDKKKSRKAVLREMKKLLKLIRNHAQNHLELFKINWEKTAYSAGQAQSIITRLERMIEFVPDVIKQAHERIIGERQVDNADKILSLYQEDVHVVKRRKAEAHNEFGSQLLLAEQIDGFITDFEFEKEKISNDSKMLSKVIDNYESKFGEAPESITTDRGFSSPKNTKLLKKKKIFNAICPKSVTELKEKMRDKKFRDKLKRRGPNEARVGIVKNNFLSGALKAFGYDRRHTGISWGILTHNLTKLTVMYKQKLDAEAKEHLKQQAA